MGIVKLYVVVGGNNYWRLRTDREAAQYLREVPCRRVKVIFSDKNEFYLDGQMRTYRFCSLAHPNINKWIIGHHLNRAIDEAPVPLRFSFTIDGDTHIYRYLGKARRTRI